MSEVDDLIKALTMGVAEEAEEESGVLQMPEEPVLPAETKPTKDVDTLISSLTQGTPPPKSETQIEAEKLQQRESRLESAGTISQSPILGGFERRPTDFFPASRGDYRRDVPGYSESLSAGLMSGLANLPLRAAGVPTGPAYEELSRPGKALYTAGKSLSDNAPWLLGGTIPLRIAAAARSVPAIPTLATAEKAVSLGVPTSAQQTFARKAVDPIIASFSVHPRAYGIGELSALSGISQASFLAQTYFPEDRNVRAVAEVAGAFINPVTATVRVSNSAVGNIWRSAARRGDTFAKQEAAQIAQDIVRAKGENPEELVRRFNELQDLPIMPGVSIESPALNAIHKNLSKSSPSLRDNTRDGLKKINDQINSQIDIMLSSGDPELVKIGVEARRDHLETQIALKLEDARTTAELAVARITDNRTSAESQLAAEAASQAAIRQINEVNDWAVKAQDELYTAALDKLDEIGLVPLKQVYDAFPNTIAAVSGLTGRRQPGEDLDRLLGELFGSRIKRSLSSALAGEDVTYRGMHNIAVDAGEKAAAARKAGRYGEASAFETLRVGILDDLDAIPDTNLVNARAFTKAYKDTFQRTFVKNATGEGVPPGVAMQNALVGGGLKAREKFQALENAANFDNPNAPPSVPRPEAEINFNSQQEAFMLSYASQFIKDGRVDRRALNNFVNRNAALIDEISQTGGGANLKSILQDADATEAALVRAIAENDLKKTHVAEVNIFTRLLDPQTYPDLDRAIADVFVRNPEENVRLIASMLRESTSRGKLTAEELDLAKKGMVNAIWDTAIANSTNAGTGVVNWRRVNAALSDDLIGALQRNTILTKAQADNMTRLRDLAFEQQRALESTSEIEDILPNTDFLSELIIRGGGSTLATRIGRQLGVLGVGQAGPSLVIAQGGSRAAQQLLGLNPKGKVTAILSEATTNPRLMKELLEMQNVSSPEALREGLKTTGAVLFGAQISNAFTEEEMDYIFGRFEDDANE